MTTFFMTRPYRIIVALGAFAAGGLAGSSRAQETPLPADVESPAFLVGEPLPTGDVRAGPGQWPRVYLPLIALLPPALLWFVLALRRNWREYGLHERRTAHREMRRLLDRIARRGGPPGPAELEQWRDLSVRLWGMELAVPTPDDVAARTARGPSGEPETWARLWQETEEALYSPRAALPADWVARAQQAAVRFGAVRPATWLPVRRRHWLPAPVALAALVAFAAGGSALDAADPAAAYQAGQFAEARKLWLEELSERPGDWLAHHNVALTYAQEGLWGGAAGHWTAARVLNPGHPAVEAGVRLSLAQIEGIDPALRRILAGSRADRLAGKFSVAQWERLSVAGALVAAAGLGLAVFSLYRVRPKLWLGAGLGLAVLGGATAGTGAFSVERYGPLGDPLVAFVTAVAELRSIPSDIITNQQSATLHPGTLVVVDRTFLSWDHILADNGVEGWIRADHLLWLYQSRAKGEVARVLRSEKSNVGPVQMTY